MARVTNLKAAREWFLKNASGSVECCREDGLSKVCECYPDAERWYKEPVHNPSKPVLVPADMPVGLMLKYEKRELSLCKHISLCAGCIAAQSEHFEETTKTYGLAAFKDYNPLSAAAALELNELGAKGMCCDCCGQVFTLREVDLKDLGWEQDMHLMDIRLAADEVMALIDGEGAKDDAFYSDPLVAKARELATLVLTPPSKKGSR
jgi:hypothetical protein